ncbi:CC-NBS-LRR resistance protein, partial [Trifolium medium]|nr:CC-NBS-LRR resistance protein [Trifolium medium]
MDHDQIIEVDLLSKEDAWTMFERYSGITNSSPNDLIDCGQSIVKECKQLPIAIAVTASNLKGQHKVYEWKVTLESLKKIGVMHRVDDAMFG